eukprot:COSAG06_NODE_1608_length_8946_cov_17.020685_5_plen_145_part_00
MAHSVVQAWGDALGAGAWYYVGVVSAAAAVIGPQVHPDVEPRDELRLLLCVLQVLRLAHTHTSHRLYPHSADARTTAGVPRLEPICEAPRRRLCTRSGEVILRVGSWTGTRLRRTSQHKPSYPPHHARSRSHFIDFTHRVAKHT